MLEVGKERHNGMEGADTAPVDADIQKDSAVTFIYTWSGIHKTQKTDTFQAKLVFQVKVI